jgi:hypothetical protein
MVLSLMPTSALVFLSSRNFYRKICIFAMLQELNKRAQRYGKTVGGTSSLTADPMSRAGVSKADTTGCSDPHRK